MLRPPLFATSSMKVIFTKAVNFGYVVDTLEAALWVFSQATDFAQEALLAVNLGHNADTVGAVYGQLASAHFESADIPAHWRNQPYEHEEITKLATGIYDLLPKMQPAPVKTQTYLGISVLARL